MSNAPMPSIRPSADWRGTGFSAREKASRLPNEAGGPNSFRCAPQVDTLANDYLPSHRIGFLARGLEDAQAHGFVTGTAADIKDLLTMPMMRAATSTLVVVDFQKRLVPAIHHGAAAVANARRLIDVAGLLAVPVVFTEQNPAGLGPTVPELAPEGAAPVHKMTFGAVGAPGFLAKLADDHALVVTGCEAHVCVLQTVLGLLSEWRKVFVVRDAVGSRHPGNKAAAIERMAAHGAEIVTTEMVVFEWLQTAAHPKFREAVALIK